MTSAETISFGPLLWRFLEHAQYNTLVLPICALIALIIFNKVLNKVDFSVTQIYFKFLEVPNHWYSVFCVLLEQLIH
jgi:hypothetical protein